MINKSINKLGLSCAKLRTGLAVIIKSKANSVKFLQNFQLELSLAIFFGNKDINKYDVNDKIKK